MADITAILGITIFLLIAYPGLLTTWNSLFPDLVNRARFRITHTPWKNFWFGLGLSALLLIPAAILIALPIAPAKILGWGVVIFTLAISSIGATGLVKHMCHGDTDADIDRFSLQSPFIRCAISLELASAFPIIGWFLVFPIATILSLGAVGFALLRWMPKTRTSLSENQETLISASSNMSEQSA